MKIFISYRRDDTSGHSGRLRDYLAPRFGEENVFMDIETIEPGEDFREVIKREIAKCDVVLVMIGKQWLLSAQGIRRLDDPKDLLRMEIASALANPKVRVIPVLVRSASMPGPQELPDDLQELSWHHAFELSDTRFQYDADQLIRAIERIAPPHPPYDPKKKWRIALGVVILGLVLGMVSYGIKAIGAPLTPSPTPIIPIKTLTSSPSPLPTLTVTPFNALPPAILTMDQYFKYINNAGRSEDLSKAWDLMTSKLRCNATDKCSFDNFRNWWWMLQVQYKLYDCGSNTVDVEVIYYGRNTSPDPSREPVYIEYELIVENGQLKLNSGDIVSGISPYCGLAISVP